VKKAVAFIKTKENEKNSVESTANPPIGGETHVILATKQMSIPDYHSSMRKPINN
jgi:hypothetical protein